MILDLFSRRVIGYRVSRNASTHLVTSTFRDAYDKNSDKLPHYPAIYQEGFFRFSVGLEDAEDVIADLKQAMKACGVL